SRLGIRTAPILLLTRPDVQTDLKLSTEQIHSSRRVIDGLYDQASALKGKPDGEVIAARRMIDEAQQRWLESQLTDSQRARLLQLDLQWEGPSAVVSRSWVSNWIGLSPEQRQSIIDAVRVRQSATEGGGRSVQEKTLTEQVLAILNEEQRERWRGLLGQPFEIQSATQTAAGAGAGQPTQR
ncbi:MAG TPA: hypothetical protein VFT74_02745, partial [Isosphaeraceae bacterium]|nr:hypothetical protein [Isosphaeraceae bacterium]